MSTRAKYTPGPWVAHIDVTEGARIMQTPTEGAKRVAWVAADDTREVKGRIVEHMSSEAQANARLIAAVPELLEAAVEMLAVLDAASGRDRRWEGEVADRCRAAIAKATGEEGER